MPDRDKDEGDRSWTEYRRLVLAELERANKAMVDMHAKIDRGNAELSDKMEEQNNHKNEEIGKLRERIVAIEVRAAVFGTIGGVGMSLLLSLIKLWPFH